MINLLGLYINNVQIYIYIYTIYTQIQNEILHYKYQLLYDKPAV